MNAFLIIITSQNSLSSSKVAQISSFFRRRKAHCFVPSSSLISYSFRCVLRHSFSNMSGLDPSGPPQPLKSEAYTESGRTRQRGTRPSRPPQATLIRPDRVVTRVASQTETEPAVPQSLGFGARGSGPVDEREAEATARPATAQICPVRRTRTSTPTRWRHWVRVMLPMRCKTKKARSERRVRVISISTTSPPSWTGKVGPISLELAPRNIRCADTNSVGSYQKESRTSTGSGGNHSAMMTFHYLRLLLLT